MAMQLCFTALLPVLTAAAFVLAEKSAFFRRLPYALRQVLIGVVFGGLVFAAATMAPTTRTSIQDMVPLAAGLLFFGLRARLLFTLLCKPAPAAFLTHNVLKRLTGGWVIIAVMVSAVVHGLPPLPFPQGTRKSLPAA